MDVYVGSDFALGGTPHSERPVIACREGEQLLVGTQVSRTDGNVLTHYVAGEFGSLHRVPKVNLTVAATGVHAVLRQLGEPACIDRVELVHASLFVRRSMGFEQNGIVLHIIVESELTNYRPPISSTTDVLSLVRIEFTPKQSRTHGRV